MASNQDPKRASGNGYFFMAALFCPMLCIAVYAMLAIINMADNEQAQTSVQVFEMPSAELEELNLDELLDLRDDISPSWPTQWKRRPSRSSTPRSRPRPL